MCGSRIEIPLGFCKIFALKALTTIFLCDGNGANPYISMKLAICPMLSPIGVYSSVSYIPSNQVRVFVNGSQAVEPEVVKGEVRAV